ncbi:hypothetical protein [Desulfoscipio gibsoniae]|uniref:hypothetical protein n=1 Tax=Desulfoscipio gibsoniae TaxID=102134 RepID=UPI00059C93A5|nr:hypothetical protein [Desulfoscipio gibsoniae]
MINMKINDLLTLELDTALELCRSTGWRVEVEFTSPPRGEMTGRYRVLRGRELPGSIVMLTVAKDVPGKEV